MTEFWVTLWFRWALWLSVASLFWALVATFVSVGGLYLLKGMPTLDSEVQGALFEIARFLFGVWWSLSFLLTFAASVKQLFGRCIGGKRLGFFDCEEDVEIPAPSWGDTAKVWRKWFFVIIWIVAAEVIVAFALSYLFGGNGLSGWFSIYWLYGFIVLAGLVSLPLMPARCQAVKVLRC